MLHCGDDDYLTTDNAALHIALKEADINHEYRVEHGYHNWEYWRTYIGEGLEFVSQKFHR
ncbi:MAG: hypothetical protein HC842_03975 [Cytophagales bacterium]|nr:hypothetical protein [Cytophagales bacterium]